jgi:uncharacterized protein
MKLRKHQITMIAVKVSEALLGTKGVSLDKGYTKEEFIKYIDHVIYEELNLEDKLNEEVREILREYSEEFDSGRVEYHRMFKMVKEKLAKEKGIVL